MYSYMTESLDKLLTVEDVMANLRISRPTLYRLLKSGHLIPVRIGKRTLFDPADIRAFVEISKQAAPSAPAKAKKETRSERPAQSRRTVKPKSPEAAVAPESTSEPIPADREVHTKEGKEKAFDDDKQGRLL